MQCVTNEFGKKAEIYNYLRLVLGSLVTFVIVLMNYSVDLIYFYMNDLTFVPF